jgi:transcriptional regulator with XRE-family HTH domain
LENPPVPQNKSKTFTVETIVSWLWSVNALYCFSSMANNEASKIESALLDVITEYRKAQNLTYEQLADKTGIHRTTIALWERGERSPTIHFALQLASGLGIELSELLSRAEAIVMKKTPKALQAVKERVVHKNHFHNEEILRTTTGLDHTSLRTAIQGTYQTLDTIDFQLQTHNSPPMSKLVELANISSMLGNLLGGQIADSSKGLYIRNKPHTYPDLLPVKPHDRNIEIKIALDTNRPKGHLPKAGTYLTFRYVLCTKGGLYKRGKENRGDTIFIWEARVGEINESDFDISNTAGDSGKTAVIKTAVFDAMSVIYYVHDYLPYSSGRATRYPGQNTLL